MFPANDPSDILVSLIAATNTSTGLKVYAELNTWSYQAGIKVSDEELEGKRSTIPSLVKVLNVR